MDKNRGWKAEWSVQTNFGDVAIFPLSKKGIYYSHKNGHCTRKWYHLFLVRVRTIRDQKHTGISPLTERIYLHVCIELTSAESWKNCTEKSFCDIFFSQKYTLICTEVSTVGMRMLTNDHNQTHVDVVDCRPDSHAIPLR